MNNIFKALNVKNQEEMDKLIESFELDDNQYIAFYSALNENMSPEGLRFVLEKVTKNFYNGSYEKLVEQYKKPSQERVLKEMPMTKDQYDKLKVGSRVKFDKPSQAPQPEEYDTIIDKKDDEIKTQFRHHGGKARTVCKWKPEHFRKVYSVSEYSDVTEPKHKIGDRVVTMNKIYNWNYAGSKIINIIPPHWQDGDEAHYSYVIRGITMDKELGKPVLSKETETVPVETIDGLNESAQSNVAYDIRLVSISGDVSEVWEQKVAMTLPEAKKISEDLIKQHLNDEDFFIATVEKGKTNWGKSADDFYGNHFVLGITNKDEETAENILGDEYYDFDKITCALTEDTVYDHSWYEVKKQKYPKRTKQGVICEAYEKFKNIVKKTNPILASSEKEGTHLWCQKELIKEFVEEYPNSINDYVYLEEEKLTAANRIAGVYNPQTNEDDDSNKHLWKHEITDEMFENGWTRYFIMDMKGGRRLYISGVERENVIKSYKYLKEKYSNLNITLYILDYMNGNNVDTLCFDENGKRTFLESKEHSIIKKLVEMFINNEQLNEAKEVEEEIVDETIPEEPVEEEKPETTKDPKLQAEIEQMNQIVDTTNNEEVLNNLLQQVDAKLPLTTDTEQMNKLAELKQKIETKLQTGVSINESYEYNPDEEEWFDIGDTVSFKWSGKNLTGTVKDVKTIGGNRYYQIASYNEADGKIHNYIDIDPIGDEMKRIYDDEDTSIEDWEVHYGDENLGSAKIKRNKKTGEGETISTSWAEEVNENATLGGTVAGNIASVGKGMGKVVKRKKKKMVDEIENHLFKEYVLNDVPCEVELNGHKMKFFENEGKWYMSVDNALVKTFDKNVMMETADEINYEEPITAELLEGYSCYEMNILMEDGDTIETVDNNTEDAELANILSSQQKTLDMDKNPEIKRQNIQAAKDMNMKSKGQNVQLLDPETSLEKDVKFIDGDEDDGIGYIQDEEGKVSEVPMNLLKTKG